MATNNEASAIVTMTTAGSGVKGSWAELIASTARATTWMLIHIASDFAVAQTFLSTFDIGIGASGSEVIELPDLGIGTDGNTGDMDAGYCTITMPYSFAAGIRLAARVNDPAVASYTFRIQIRLFE